MTTRKPVDLVFVHGLFSSPSTWQPFVDLIQGDAELASFVSVHTFRYESPPIRVRIDRRIAEVDDIADRLWTYYENELRDAASIVFVTHSQGGLVVQRLLARQVWRGRADKLSRIKNIVMFACPNSGAEFLLSVRRFAFFASRNPQERQLRPFDRVVLEAQETVVRAIVQAQGVSKTECFIPLASYGGVSDRIAPPIVTSMPFPANGVVDGDHFSIIKPTSRETSQYRIVRRALLAADEPEQPPASSSDTSSEWQVRASVTPPYGRRDTPLQGRATLMRSIESPNPPRRVHILAGLGGSGKSRLALEIAHRAEATGCRVWWVPVTRINSCMREVAVRLDAPEVEIERAWVGSASATDLVWRLLNSQEEPWLLVFDNADDPGHLAPYDGPVSDGSGWLREPTIAKGKVLVTSRDRNESTWGTWSAVHHVSPLQESDGAAVLLDRLRPEVSGRSFEEARKLSAVLGGLPLALRAAADYINDVNTKKIWGSDSAGIRDLATYRAEARRRLESTTNSDSGDLNESLGLEMEHVFGLSLELLTERGVTLAPRLLKLFACLNIAPIPYHVLLRQDVVAESPLFHGSSLKQRIAALGGLADLGLVEPHVLPDVNDEELAQVLSLHPLAHGVLRQDKEVKQRRLDYYGLNVQMLLAMTKGLDPDYPESWVMWNVLAPHAVSLVPATLLQGTWPQDRQVTASALELARLTARYLIVTGLLGPAQDLINSLISQCHVFGLDRDDREILALRHEEGRIALDRGEPMAAEEKLRQVIAGRTQILGEDHADTLASRHKFAKAILEQGRWAEAEPLLRSIVNAENSVRGPEHADTMVVRHSLARAILNLGRAAEAERMIREVLDIRRRIWSPTTPETLFVRRTLAKSLAEQGKDAEAEAEARDAIREAGDRWHAPAVMHLRYILAVALVHQGKEAAAISDLSQLLVDRIKALGPSHPETERTRVLLAQAKGIPPDQTDGSSRQPGAAARQAPMPRTTAEDSPVVLPTDRSGEDRRNV
ncbi:alpha/beta fold hydrolase [Micromonospora sp. NPDC049101]|uniref:alpha/beta hydrolase n=1 Tax=Micromonospora sp. NPDC049101 TaxID=3155032 RepID=UPI0033CB6882